MLKIVIDVFNQNHAYHCFKILGVIESDKSALENLTSLGVYSENNFGISRRNLLNLSKKKHLYNHKGNVKLQMVVSKSDLKIFLSIRVVECSIYTVKANYIFQILSDVMTIVLFFILCDFLFCFFFCVSSSFLKLKKKLNLEIKNKFNPFRATLHHKSQIQNKMYQKYKAIVPQFLPIVNSNS